MKSLIKRAAARRGASLKLSLLALTAAAGWAVACSGWSDYPALVVDWDAQEMLELPRWSFEDEMRHLRNPQAAGGIRAVKSFSQYGSPTERSSEIDIEDFYAALPREASSAERIRRLREYADLRRRTERVAELRDRYESAGTVMPHLPYQIAPRGDVPEEFALYLKGHVAARQGRTGEAHAYWQQLLALAPDARRWRTTWAAYRIARLKVDAPDPDAAVAALRDVRTLAASGFTDSNGLAAAALGWEARVELRRDEPIRAARLYLQQFNAGDDEAADSLEVTCDRIIGSPQHVAAAVADGPLREVLLAYCLAPGGRNPGDAYKQLPGSVVAGVLNEIDRQGIVDIATAGRLAHLAYRTGDYATAARWAAVAPRDDSYARWIQSKLLLRRGDVSAATAVLRGVVRETARGPRVSDFGFDDERAAFNERAAGELARLRLRAEDFTEAFDLFVDTGFEADATLMLERVYSIEEAQAALARQRGRAAAWQTARASDGAGAALAWRLSEVVARRLVRANRLGEAVAYFRPGTEGDSGPASRTRFEAYRAALAAADDTTRSDAERAAAGWRAARTLHGEARIFLTAAFEPAWSGVSGEPYPPQWTGRTEQPDGIFGPAMNERLRYQRTDKLEPLLNRQADHRAAEHAWAAAALVPDNSEALAKILFTAGSWLKIRDVTAADRFYKAVVTRCNNLDIGKAADRNRWFPSTWTFATASPAAVEQQAAAPGGRVTN